MRKLTAQAIPKFLFAFFLVIACFFYSERSSAQSNGVIKGTILNAETLHPVDFAQVYIQDLNRSSLTTSSGSFTFTSIPKGSYVINVHRLGFHDSNRKITIQTGDTLTLTFMLKDASFQLQEVVVKDQRYSEENELVGEPVHKLTGSRLRQKLGSTLAETISKEPGMAQRSMGPAPARPVLRGLGGDRLLILEDGERTGDLSATSNDHAVVIDPLNADGIEVHRGPSALQFGANTLAGVINVRSNSIPTSIPERWRFTGTVQSETVNEGVAGGLATVVPLGKWAVGMNLSLRNAGDIGTPTGRLLNTDFFNGKATLGTSYHDDWGYVGGFITQFESNYGIPGGFIGAHPNGVDIELQRFQTGLESTWYPQIDFLHHISGSFTYTEYFHQEYESNGSLGMEFGVLTSISDVRFHFEPQSYGQTTVGLWHEFRDFATGGLTRTPNTKEQTIAGFLYHKKNWESVDLEFSFRSEQKSVRPDEQRFSQVVGQIEDRTFWSWAAGIESSWQLHPYHKIGFRGMNTFRSPGIEELFSEGPHLAAYSFEVGNADNTIEKGRGLDLYYEFATHSSLLSLTLYRNDISGYIYPRNTGDLNLQTLLPVYQFTGNDALFYGFEFIFKTHFLKYFQLYSSSSYTHATIQTNDTPVPFIPPLTNEVTVSYQRSGWDIHLSTTLAAAQERAGEFEEPTDGFVLIGAGLERVITFNHALHTVTVELQNALNATYRNHLSRVKSVMPEPGVNVRLLYRIYI